MPEHAVQVYRQFGHEVAHAEFKALFGIPAFGERADKMIFIGDAKRAVELAEFVEMRGVGGRFRRADPNAKSGFLQQLNPFDSLLPCSLAPVEIVIFGAATVEADLYDQVIVGDGFELLQSRTA